MIRLCIQEMWGGWIPNYQNSSRWNARYFWRNSYVSVSEWDWFGRLPGRSRTSSRHISGASLNSWNTQLKKNPGLTRYVHNIVNTVIPNRQVNMISESEIRMFGCHDNCHMLTILLYMWNTVYNALIWYLAIL